MAERPAPRAAHTPDPSRSHTGRVVDDLGLAIVSNQIAQGALLPLDTMLTARYHVSRTVIREAVKTLAAKGLVQARARVGTRVRDRDDWNLFDPDVLLWHARSGLSADFLKHLGEMRLALEPEAAALASQRRTASHLKEMWDCVAEMGAPEITRGGFVKADLGLHLLVARASANPFMVSVSTLIEVALVAMLTTSSPVEDPRRLSSSVSQHRSIVAAIEAGDAEGARAAMAAVVQTGIDRSRPSPPDGATAPHHGGRSTA
jgi:DNA-binding FadR family transcriptional regulator